MDGCARESAGGGGRGGGGLSAVAAGVRFVRSLEYGVDALDPRLLLAVCGLIGAAAAMATILPAWRAARIDPMAALRENN